MKLKLYFLLLNLTVTISYAVGQELDSVSMSLEDGIVVVRYDFLVGEPEVDYELYLYGSHDNFLSPLQETTGDVGKGVKIGAGKVIYWNAQKELGNFKGDFSLKIKGDKYIPIVEFQNISDQLKLKRGNQLNIEWKSNLKSEDILLTIERNGVPVVQPAIIDNTGEFNWLIPEDIKPSNAITIKMSDPSNLLRNETSMPFSVKRRIPLGLKIIPAAIIAGGVAYLLMPKPTNEIPEPPGPPALN